MIIAPLASMVILFSEPKTDPLPAPAPQEKQEQIVLAKEEMFLADRYEEKQVNEIFKDNILLALHYLRGDDPFYYDRKENKKAVNWEKAGEEFTAEFILKPREVFAFHDSVLPEFKDKVVKTTNSHFNFQEGYLSSGYLYGDGVCHLASLMNWAGHEAGLGVLAKADHSFREIPGIPKEHGTSVITGKASSQDQNLYITNNLSFPVKFSFKANSQKIELGIIKVTN